jgi:hypothetical protein
MFFSEMVDFYLQLQFDEVEKGLWTGKSIPSQIRTWICDHIAAGYYDSTGSTTPAKSSYKASLEGSKAAKFGACVYKDGDLVTPATYTYVDPGLPLMSAKKFAYYFQVKTPSDANILLVNDVGAVQFEIIIGFQSNSRIVIRNDRQGPSVTSAEMVGLLSNLEYREFWISFNGELLTVGAGGFGSDAILLTYKSPKDPRKILVSTSRGSTGYWKTICQVLADGESEVETPPQEFKVVASNFLDKYWLATNVTSKRLTIASDTGAPEFKSQLNWLFFPGLSGWKGVQISLVYPKLFAASVFSHNCEFY